MIGVFKCNLCDAIFLAEVKNNKVKVIKILKDGVYLSCNHNSIKDLEIIIKIRWC